MSLKLHRACKTLGFTEKQIELGWPQAFHLEQIARLQFPDSARDKSVFYSALESDCMGGSLKHRTAIERRPGEISRHIHSFEALKRAYIYAKPDEVTVHYVNACDLAVWLERQGEKPSVHLAAWIEATTPEPNVTTPTAPVPQTAPVGAVGASGGVVTDKAGPVVKTPAQGNSTKPRRKDSIDPVIELAQTKCRDPKDINQVWPQMQVLADNEEAPFLASTSKGLKYHKGDKDAYLTRDALNKRLHPEKRKSAARR